jgi:protein-tyrosine phosphatase
MKTWIDSRYGTWRGLVRALLAQLELATGRLQSFALVRPETVQRLVFVCHGNVCRSAFAHREALKYGLNVASFGLSASAGAGSPAKAVASAERLGVDLKAHTATPWGDFEVHSGDQFLVMEVRHAHELRRRLGERDDVQICLLGMWCKRAMPHLHDPYTLGERYFDRCFERIRQAIQRLNLDLANASAPVVSAGLHLKPIQPE